MSRIVILVVLGVWGLAGVGLAQTQKAPEAVTAQMRAAPKPAPDELVKLLESKGILSETEAALVDETQLQPQTKELLAEILLLRRLINEKEYDRTLEACSSTPASAAGSGKAGEPRAARSMFGRSGNGEPSGFESFSDWITSILPGGGQTTDVDFGTIQPAPLWPEGAPERSQHGRAKAGKKSPKHHRQDASQTTSGAEGGGPKQ